MGRMHARQIRSTMLHTSFEGIIERMDVVKRQRLTAQEKVSVVESLQQYKQNQRIYDLGKNQLKVLDELIRRAKKAKTRKDLLSIHSNTCTLGLKKQ
ncbi:MAG: hypothetical protein HON47_00425 [Candidatus Diapherotrites archaeon]|jgi:hypothetical protein|uniref:Uncharacterized protein n=1 Tax=Candidatus Iainarchaeum sp. TaxID=3101447 RepID=A0A8T5GDI5_9ARCH|nr:hypothetical protein [Candidatus Diapherotrites archaeon]MBT7241079.1 hypothetical protein [Candidatus Diapherotrites archaeon]